MTTLNLYYLDGFAKIVGIFSNNYEGFAKRNKNLVRLPDFSARRQASMEEAELFRSRLLDPVLSTSLPDSGPGPNTSCNLAANHPDLCLCNKLT
jgi:hypothetical protein